MKGSATARVDRLAREHRDWAPYLAVLRAVLTRLDEPGAVWALAPDPVRPLLDGAEVTVDASTLDRRVRRLLGIAADHGGARSLGDAARSRALDAVAMIHAAIAHDDARLTSLAESVGAESAALSTVAHLAVVPLLHAARRGHDARSTWNHGYCPVCGGWPTLAEARGLDRERRLRCGRCGSDWRTEWLSCCFCGNGDHLTLGALVPDDGTSESRRADTCDACRSYLKLVTTLTPIEPADVLLEDLATVTLDLAAIEHGYRRPEGAGVAPSVRVVPERAWSLGGLLRR